MKKKYKFILAFILLSAKGVALAAEKGTVIASSYKLAPAQKLTTCSKNPGLFTKVGTWKNAVNTQALPLFASHSAADGTFVTGEPIAMRAEFIYGGLKALEKELIDVFVDVCGPQLQRITTVETDEEGQIRFSVPVPEFTTGIYHVFFVVQADGTWADATIRVVPADTQFVVFTLDGTLTTDDSENIEGLASPANIPTRRIYSEKITQQRSAQGYEIIYLTSRPMQFRKLTKKWHSHEQMATGTMVFTDGSHEAPPAAEDLGGYKLSYLESLKVRGLHVKAAYGNAPSDIYAFEKAQIPEVYIVGKNDPAGKFGDDFRAHSSAISKQPTVEQPFSRR